MARSYFSANEVEEFQRVFQSFDRNKSGDITPSDIQLVMKDLGHIISQAEAQHLLTHIDNSGRINFDSFLKLMERSRGSFKKANKEEARKRAEEEMRQSFKVFDRDGNGLIDKSELKATMKSLGENLSDKDIKAMIRAADKNGDGKIDYEEFIKMMYAQGT